MLRAWSGRSFALKLVPLLTLAVFSSNALQVQTGAQAKPQTDPFFDDLNWAPPDLGPVPIIVRSPAPSPAEEMPVLEEPSQPAPSQSAPVGTPQRLPAEAIPHPIQVEDLTPVSRSVDAVPMHSPAMQERLPAKTAMIPGREPHPLVPAAPRTIIVAPVSSHLWSFRHIPHPYADHDASIVPAPLTVPAPLDADPFAARKDVLDPAFGGVVKSSAASPSPDESEAAPVSALMPNRPERKVMRVAVAPNTSREPVSPAVKAYNEEMAARHQRIVERAKAEARARAARLESRRYSGAASRPVAPESDPVVSPAQTTPHPAHTAVNTLVHGKTSRQ